MFRHLLLAAAVLGALAVATDSATAQAKLFRGNNPAVAPPPKVFPPAPPIPMVNNGSLQTTANPNSALPNQVPFIYIAALPQDCRLNNNGVFVWEPRLDSMCAPLMAQNNNNGGGNLGTNLGNNGGNLGTNLGGQVQAFGAMRGSPLAGYGYPGYYTAGVDAARAYMGSNFGGNVSRMATPAPAYTGGYNWNGANLGNSNFFTSLTPNTVGNNWGNLGNFGGDNNPFDAFKAANLDALDDQDKKVARKEDADKQK